MVIETSFSTKALSETLVKAKFENNKWPQSFSAFRDKKIRQNCKESWKTTIIRTPKGPTKSIESQLRFKVLCYSLPLQTPVLRSQETLQ